MNYPASKIAQFVYDDMKEFTSRELEADITSAVFKYRLKSQVVVEQDDDNQSDVPKSEENNLD